MRHFPEHCVSLGKYKIQLASKHLSWLGYEHKLRAKFAYMTAKKGWVQDNQAIGQGLQTEHSSTMLGDITWWWHGPPLSSQASLSSPSYQCTEADWITKDSQHPTLKYEMQKPKTCKIYPCHRKNEGGMKIKYSTTLNKYSENQRITAPLRLERTSKTIGSKH